MILIAGPCVLESHDTVMRIAEGLIPFSEDCTKRSSTLRPVLDKANRDESQTHIDAVWTLKMVSNRC